MSDRDISDFYGPTNDDYNAVFTGWLVTETTPGDPILSDSGYPAYDSIEALDLERKAGTYDEIRPELAATEEDAYTLLLSYAVNPICVGDVHSAPSAVAIPARTSKSPSRQP